MKTMAAIVGPLFVGVVGGLSANFLARTAWDYYTRPILDVAGSPDISFDYNEDGELKTAHYSFLIQNKGKQPARNCSAKMYLDGRTDNGHTYYEGRLPWEGEAGNLRMTINPNQQVKVEFCRAIYQDHPGILQFPVNGQWDKSKRGVIIGKGDDKRKPIQDHWEGNDSVGAAFGMFDRELMEGNWEENKIEITSENGGRLKITPEFTHPDGTYGMDVDIASHYTSRYP